MATRTVGRPLNLRTGTILLAVPLDLKTSLSREAGDLHLGVGPYVARILQNLSDDERLALAAMRVLR